ncbi:MAG TPA: hypothetical protein VKZ60_18570 [Chloroflexota bacterium]|jgi:hypothetical protein|nr:hypothetical protein [Chloroflexota bacterium]
MYDGRQRERELLTVERDTGQPAAPPWHRPGPRSEATECGCPEWCRLDHEHE